MEFTTFLKTSGANKCRLETPHRGRTRKPEGQGQHIHECHQGSETRGHGGAAWEAWECPFTKW